MLLIPERPHTASKSRNQCGASHCKHSGLAERCQRPTFTLSSFRLSISLLFRESVWVRLWCRAAILQCSSATHYSGIPLPSSINTPWRKWVWQKQDREKECEGRQDHIQVRNGETYCGHTWLDPVFSTQNLQTSPYRLDRNKIKRLYTYNRHSCSFTFDFYHQRIRLLIRDHSPKYLGKK